MKKYEKYPLGSLNYFTELCIDWYDNEQSEHNLFHATRNKRIDILGLTLAVSRLDDFRGDARDRELVEHYLLSWGYTKKDPLNQGGTWPIVK